MLPSLFNDRIFDDMIEPFDMFNALNHSRNAYKASALMKTDIKEHDQSYELNIELAGYKKEDVKLELDNGYMTITAETKAQDNKEEKGRFIRRERFYGSCSRSFQVNEDLKPEDVSAKFEDGILKITFPKMKAPKAPEQKLISID